MKKYWAIFLILLNGCFIDYLLDKGHPNFEKHKELQVKSDGNCKEDKDCQKGMRCIELQLKNCEENLNCLSLIERDDEKATCRKPCRQQQACPTSQRCLFVDEKTEGVCVAGFCNSDADCGHNIDLLNVCLDAHNGPGSGICARSCDPINCHEGICPDCPKAEAGCEFNPETNQFICMPSGKEAAFLPCNQDALACLPGLFCYLNQCRPYCHIDLLSCASPQKCRPFFENSKVGFCDLDA